MSGKKKISSVKLTLYIVTAALIIIIIGLLVFSSLIVDRSAKEIVDPSSISSTSTTTTERVILSALDGKPIPADRADLQLLAVIIENHGQARPQSGLNSAEIVFETVAEGGITRFLAIFQRNSPLKIGPIRSAREYFADIARGYDTIFVHAGGSPTGVEIIKQLNVDAINGLNYDDSESKSAHFWRATDRKAPHNFYSDDAKLRDLAKGLEYNAEDQTVGFSFKHESAVEQRPNSARLSIDFSQSNYVVAYEYNRLLNNYVRSNGGKEIIDKEDGQPIAPHNVLLLQTIITPLDSMGRQRIDLEGSGLAYLFSDGEMTTLNWFHGSPYEEIQFFQISGKKMELVPGQTWVEIISADMNISYFENGQEVSLIPEAQ